MRAQTVLFKWIAWTEHEYMNPPDDRPLSASENQLSRKYTLSLLSLLGFFFNRSTDQRTNFVFNLPVTSFPLNVKITDDV